MNDDLRRATLEVAIAQNAFDWATDELAIDAAIFALVAAEHRQRIAVISARKPLKVPREKA